MAGPGTGLRGGASTRTVHLTIRGRVQGVGFRWHVRESARRAAVSGWVRNCPDGSVEALLAGDSDAVSRVMKAVRQGPPAARVETIDVRDVADAEVPPTFMVK